MNEDDMKVAFDTISREGDGEPDYMVMHISVVEEINPTLAAALKEAGGLPVQGGGRVVWLDNGAVCSATKEYAASVWGEEFE